MNKINSVITGFKSEKRIIRYFLAVTIVLFVVANFLSNEARAETGDITIVSSSSKTYEDTTAGALSPALFTKIYYNSANYNKINDFRLTKCSLGGCAADWTFANDFRSTSFNITAGGVGGGYAWYDKNSSYVYWVFDASDTFTSSPITLSYAVNIFSDLGWTPQDGGAAPGINTPIAIGSTTVGKYTSREKIIANVESTTTDHYVVTYFSNHFILNVTKGGSVADKWFIYDKDGNEYTRESSFNTVNFQAINSSANGLAVNVTFSSGAYSYRVINATTTIPSTTTPTGNITTNKNSYNTSENILYNYTLSNAPTGLTDNRVKIFRYDESFNQIPIFIDYAVSNGIGNKSYFIPNDTISWHYYISLESYNTTTGWQELDFKLINITKLQPSISLNNILYYYGEYIYIFTTATENGYIVLKDTNGATKFYKSISAGYTGQDYYWIRSSDAVGNWSVSLYNSSDSLIAIDYATIEYDVISEQTPTPTITPTPTPTMQQYPGGEGRAWTNAEIITWLSIYIPLLAQYIFIMLFIVITVSIGNMLPKRPRYPRYPRR